MRPPRRLASGARAAKERGTAWQLESCSLNRTGDAAHQLEPEGARSMAEAEGDIIEIDLTQLKKMKVSVLVQYLAHMVHFT